MTRWAWIDVGECVCVACMPVFILLILVKLLHCRILQDSKFFLVHCHCLFWLCIIFFRYLELCGTSFLSKEKIHVGGVPVTVKMDAIRLLCTVGIIVKKEAMHFWIVRAQPQIPILNFSILESILMLSTRVWWNLEIFPRSYFTAFGGDCEVWGKCL